MREHAPPPSGYVSAFDEGDLSGAPIQRTVDAATAPRLHVTAPSSPFNWRPAGELPDLEAPSDSNADASANDKPPEETTTMTREASAPNKRTPKGATARFQICALLMAKGDLTRDEILADVSADKNAVYQAFFAAKKAEHITFIEKSDKWRITPAGKDWTSGGANLDNQRAPAAKPAAPPKSQRKAKRVAVGDIVVRDKAATPPSMPRSFRCAVYSDGGFMLAKGDARIELDADEHAGMLRYLERMAEDQATA